MESAIVEVKKKFEPTVASMASISPAEKPKVNAPNFENFTFDKYTQQKLNDRQDLDKKMANAHIIKTGQTGQIS
jgi:predicted alpha/beta hydrolase family esterase